MVAEPTQIGRAEWPLHDPSEKKRSFRGEQLSRGGSREWPNGGQKWVKCQKTLLEKKRQKQSGEADIKTGGPPRRGKNGNDPHSQHFRACKSPIDGTKKAPVHRTARGGVQKRKVRRF